MPGLCPPRLCAAGRREPGPPRAARARPGARLRLPCRSPELVVVSCRAVLSSVGRCPSPLRWIGLMPRCPVVSDDSRYRPVDLPGAAALILVDRDTHRGPLYHRVTRMVREPFVPVVGRSLHRDSRVRALCRRSHTPRVRRVPLNDDPAVTGAPLFEVRPPAPRVRRELPDLPPLDCRVDHCCVLITGHAPPLVPLRGLPHPDDEHVG